MKKESKKSYPGFLLHSWVVTLVLSVLLAGCAVGPDYQPPEVEVPDQWPEDQAGVVPEDQAEVVPEEEPSLQEWWTTLGDPLLNNLIQQATAGNFSLREAFGRIQRARGMRRIAVSERYPNLSLTGFYNRGQESRDMGLGRSDSFYGTTMEASWEIDLWGKITRSIESANAGLEATVENYRDVMVILCAEVALNYVDARTLQQRIKSAESNVRTQQGSLLLAQARFKAEIAPQLDVYQAELNLARTESIIPTLKSSLVQAINRIAVLLGESSGALQTEFEQVLPIPSSEQGIPSVLPANLLQQRPDVRQAERELAYQTARIGVAEADLYPRFDLDGYFGYEGLTDNAYNSENRIWGVGPRFSWDLFTGGAIRGQVQAEEALTQEARARYQETVLTAVEEVENAMEAFAQESKRKEKLSLSVEAARKSVKLVQVLYKSGLTDFQNVLDMERSLFQQQDELAMSEGLVTRNLVSLYKALGGGWSPEIEVSPEEINRQDQLQPPTTE